MRASQINGCAYCLDMHTKGSRALSESERRLHLLAALRAAPCYDARPTSNPTPAGQPVGLAGTPANQEGEPCP
jgi:AhpD family alkylhydroperoxidase